ncbi:MAG: NADH-quinone oxidoreductase subunit NuoG [Pantoea sp. Brub]|nr:NADH-quinone oxidoreductase subunit NuoG [Pantoea sp. Brub]
MITIHIDGKKYSVNEKDNLLKICLSFGLDIPYFCWHPVLGSIGACRQCAIKQFKNSKDTVGFIVMSCMTPAVDNTYISIEDSEVKKFRKSIIELLMNNHPHDCPVCEEGGNCHLQDMTVMNGHTLRKYRYNKRSYYNQNISPFIRHEMNRCITCYRCIRYYKDYSGGKSLGVYGTHDNIYFGCIDGDVLNNEFSGNLIEICPTGVFTDKLNLDNYSRKWDMQFAPSICQHCSIGCNISVSERYGKICRINNRYNGTLNHYFLCDLGRFNYGYINRKDRPLYPIELKKHQRVKISIQEALNTGANIFKKAKKVIGIGSPRASLESNFALYKLVGAENFYVSTLDIEQKCLDVIIKILFESGINIPSLREVENCDAILILGEDVTQVGARLALSIRQAIKSKAYKIAKKYKIESWHATAISNIAQNDKYPLFLTNFYKTKLDDISSWSYYAAVEDQARLGFAIANSIDCNSPCVIDFNNTLKNKVNLIVKSLINAKKPLIISGVHSGSSTIIEAAGNIARSLKCKGSDVSLILLSRYTNSIGLSIIGQKTLNSALKEINNGKADTLVILENDLYRYAPKQSIDSALTKAANIIAIDHQNTDTVKKANLVFPTASYVESSGTVINNEGRAQRFFQVYNPSYYDNNIILLASWRWLHYLKNKINNCDVSWKSLDNVIDDLIVNFPNLKEIKSASPNANFRIHGQKISRLPCRASGRTAILANKNIHEPRQPQDVDTMFTFSMEGNNQPQSHNSQIPFAWYPGWNSVQSWNKFQNEIGGELIHGDPGVKIFTTTKTLLPWFNNIPNAFIPSNFWRIVPLYKLFDSEEMFQRDPIFQQIALDPILLLNKEDAYKLKFSNNIIVQFTCLGQIFKFPIKTSSKLQSGQIGLPIGMPGVPLFLINRNIDNLQEVI